MTPIGKPGMPPRPDTGRQVRQANRKGPSPEMRVTSGTSKKLVALQLVSGHKASGNLANILVSGGVIAVAIANQLTGGTPHLSSSTCGPRCHTQSSAAERDRSCRPLSRRTLSRGPPDPRDSGSSAAVDAFDAFEIIDACCAWSFALCPLYPM